MGRLSGGIGGKAGGGSSKSRSRGSTETIVKKRPLPTKGESLIVLRSCLFEDKDQGTTVVERDVTQWLAPAFRTYSRNGLDAEIVFAHGQELVGKLLNDLVTMVDEFGIESEESAGREWVLEDKEEQLLEEQSRYLLVKNKSDQEIMAFAHFRFTIHGELTDSWEGCPCLFVNDIHVLPEHRRKGLGRHLMTMLELIARKGRIEEIIVPVPNSDAAQGAMDFFTDGLRGFAEDDLRDIAPGVSRALRSDGSLKIFAKPLVPRMVEEPLEEEEPIVEEEAEEQTEESAAEPEEKPVASEKAEEAEDDWGLAAPGAPKTPKKKNKKKNKAKKVQQSPVSVAFEQERVEAAIQEAA